MSLGYNAKDQTSSLTPPGGSALAQSYTGATQIQRVTEASTSATLAYRYTHDLRAVQDMLGHQDPKTTARYARVVDRAKTNPALKVPVDL